MKGTRFAPHRRQSGFTLMEVLLVLAILVIIGGTATVYFARMGTSAYQDTAKIQINNFRDALRYYHLHVGAYPTTAQGLNALRQQPLDLANPLKWKGPYLEEEIPLDPWDNEYQYELLSQTQPPHYRIWSYGPDMVDGTEDDVSNVQ